MHYLLWSIVGVEKQSLGERMKGVAGVAGIHGRRPVGDVEADEAACTLPQRISDGIGPLTYRDIRPGPKRQEHNTRDQSEDSQRGDRRTPAHPFDETLGGPSGSGVDWLTIQIAAQIGGQIDTSGVASLRILV